MRWLSAFALGLALGGCAQLADLTTSDVPPPLPIETFGPSRGAGIRTLVAIVDGGGPADIRTRFARATAAALLDSAAVAILPPPESHAQGEPLTIERIRAIGATVSALRSRYPSAEVILVGHAMGAALVADVAGTHRALIDAMVLVSCPCTLPEWRKHDRVSGAQDNIGDLDPLLTAGGIEPDLRAVILVGSDDKRTPPRFSRAYAEALALRGIATDFRVLPGRTHDMLGDPETLDAVRRVRNALHADTPS